MARKAAYCRFLPVVAGLLCCLAVATTARAQGTGYDGLVAPARQPAAPAPGYGGVIPAEKNFTPENPAPGMTSPPGLEALSPPRTSDDLRLRAMLYEQDKKDGTLRVSPEISARTVAVLAEPRPRIKDMLPQEYTARKSIEHLMPTVTDTKIPGAARVENAHRAYQQLSGLAEAMRRKKEMPDRIYRQMGVSDAFIREEKEGATAALSRLEKALEELKPYQ